MAVDTRDKRGSVIGLSGVVVLPIANNDIDAGDRQQCTQVYRGILADEPPEGTDSRTWYHFFIDREGLDSISFNDRVVEYLSDRVVDNGSFNDMLFEWLGTKGYVGALEDRISQWESDGLPE